MALIERWREWLKLPATRQCVVKMAAVCLLAGLASAVIATAGLRSADHANSQAIEALRVGCKAGNDRSLIQREEILENQQQTDTLDLGALLGIENPDDVDKLRALTKANNQRKLLKIPFIDCLTGIRLDPGVVPPGS